MIPERQQLAAACLCRWLWVRCLEWSQAIWLALRGMALACLPDQPKTITSKPIAPCRSFRNNQGMLCVHHRQCGPPGIAWSLLVHVIEASKLTVKIAVAIAVCGAAQKWPIDSSHSFPGHLSEQCCCQQASIPACQLWKDTATVHGGIGAQ